MEWYGVDLHIHSALSPCAEREMSPRAIAAALRSAGVHIAAVTDHNSCQNSEAASVAMREAGIAAIHGMELETAEESHVLCLFGSVAAALAWQEYVYSNMPCVALNERLYGEQQVFGVNGEKLDQVSRLLLVSAEIPLDVATTRVRALGGICIAAHVDRSAYSVLSVLGFIPPGADLAAVEIGGGTSVADAQEFPGVAGYTLVSFSDAHRLGDIQPARTAMRLAHPSFEEICMALRGQGGRRVVVID